MSSILDHPCHDGDILQESLGKALTPSIMKDCKLFTLSSMRFISTLVSTLDINYSALTGVSIICLRSSATNMDFIK